MSGPPRSRRATRSEHFFIFLKKLCMKELTFYAVSLIINKLSFENKLNAAMAQQVEHVLGKDEVTGSNPVSSSTAAVG